jgi:hypothetical protein
VLRISGPNRDEETGDWRKLHNEELNEQHSSPNTIRVAEMNGMGGVCSTYGERRGVYRVLVGKPEGKRPLGIPRRR